MDTKGLILRGGRRVINSNWSHLYQQPRTLGFRFVLQAINYYEAALKSGQQNFLRFVSAMFNEVQFSYLWSTTGTPSSMRDIGRDLCVSVEI